LYNIPHRYYDNSQAYQHYQRGFLWIKAPESTPQSRRSMSCGDRAELKKNKNNSNKNGSCCFQPDVVLQLIQTTTQIHSIKNSNTTNKSTEALLQQLLDQFNTILYNVSWIERGDYMEAIDQSDYLAFIETNIIQYIQYYSITNILVIQQLQILLYKV
jgi:hypothetical protein